MSALDLSSKTVLELRKIAKEQGVKLGAGISKAGIIAKLEEAMDAPAEPGTAAVPEIPEKAEVSAPAEPEPAATPAEPAAPARSADAAAQQPQFRAAWHNPAPRYGAKPAYQAPAYNNQRPQSYARPAAPQNDAPRTSQTRPTGYTPRFGPSAAPETTQHQETPAYRQEEDFRPAYRAEQPARPAYNQERRPYGEVPRPAYEAPRGYESRPAYERPAYESRPAYDERPQQRPALDNQGYDNGYNRAPRPGYTPQRRDNGGYYNAELGTSNPAVSEMLAAGECADGSGVLEMHPDGYGFLRGDTFLPSSKDIYVSMAQIRRFGLRTGDHVVGKTRPQRDGDKYTALLYINEVNGQSPDTASSRPIFEELTPVYPTRRINLEAHDLPHQDMRLIDLIAPLGFGQRALLLCPPDTGKTELLRDFANVITRNHPEATVMVLLLDETPEDVTAFRDAVDCTVLASTFDQPPENHLRLTDVVQSRAERLVEQGKDVVLIVDSLTRLAKVYTTAAQQVRSTPGMVNPSSLFRAKKLFGSARCMKEGGSLTIIAAMNVDTGSKVDDSVVEEFKGTANMELLLDASIARAGVRPAINLPMSGTKRAEALLDRSQMEGLQLIRSIMASTRSVTAIPQLLSMLEMATTNDELLVKIKDWTQLMNK